MSLFSKATFHSCSLIWMEVGHVNSPYWLGYRIDPAGIRDLTWLWSSLSPFGSIPRHRCLVIFTICQEPLGVTERSIQVNCVSLGFYLENIKSWTNVFSLYRSLLRLLYCQRDDVPSRLWDDICSLSIMGTVIDKISQKNSSTTQINSSFSFLK